MGQVRHEEEVGRVRGEAEAWRAAEEAKMARREAELAARWVLVAGVGAAAWVWLRPAHLTNMILTHDNPMIVQGTGG